MTAGQIIGNDVRSNSETVGILAELRRYLEPEPPAISLPPRAFTSPELYELERTRIFGRSWILIAHTDQLATPGDYVALTIAGEPLVVTRDKNGALHGMSPVCRHRMMPVVEPGAGNTTSFTCPYHLWRYGLDGRLIGATFMRGNPDFDPQACRLPAFAVQEWHGFVYVNLDPHAAPLTPHLSTISSELTNYQLNEMVQVTTWIEEWHCNWKIAVENAHENYHAMGLHPNTVEPLMSGAIDMSVRADSALVTRMLSPFREPIEPAVLSLTEEEKAVMYSFRVFPCSSVATFGDAIVWISLIPLSIDRTEVRGGTLLPAAMVEGADLEVIRKEGAESSAVINAEDQRGLEAVQRAVGSRFTERGHLSPKEPGVLAFYRNLALAMVENGDEI
ncbi:MAG: aromatic ring-hydroxylating oxygenase subunit alpha [Pseudonocardiaceae bacterium]